MSQDRFIHWDTLQQLPTKEDLEKALAEFFQEFATDIGWQDDRWYVTLVNKDWIEVYVSDEDIDPNIDVITRMAKPATNGLAERLQMFLFHRFHGKYVI